MVNLSTAGMFDSAGAKVIFPDIRKRRLPVKHLFADGGYDRLKLMSKADHSDFVVELARQSDDQKGYKVLPVDKWLREPLNG